MRVVTLWTIVVCAALPAAADGPPIVGYFRHFGPSEFQSDPSDQLACAFGFFHQDAAGNGNDYLFDQEAFARTGKISYRVGTTFTCNYDAAIQSEICQISSPLEALDAGTVYFLYYDIRPDSVGFQTFGSLDELRAAAAAREPGKVPADLQRFLRCDGWTEPALAPFIDTTPVDPADQVLPNSLAYPFAGDERDANLKQAEQIRNAILGQ